jgi:hypothetical protein
VGVLVDCSEVVDGDGMALRPVAFGGFCGLVVEFGYAGEPADEVAASVSAVVLISAARGVWRQGDA